MAHYVITGAQLAMGIGAAAAFITASAASGMMYIQHIDLPEVHIDASGDCTRVVNFRNGDAFVCQDRDVTLRKYRVVSEP